MISMGVLLHSESEKLHSHRKENECLTVRCIEGVLYLECYAKVMSSLRMVLLPD